MVPKKDTFFNDDWLKVEKYSKWLAKGQNNMQFSCILCKKVKTKSSWQLSNMGVGALESHIKSKAHKNAEGIGNIQPSIAVTFQNSKSASNDKSKCAKMKFECYKCVL